MWWRDFNEMAMNTLDSSCCGWLYIMLVHSVVDAYLSEGLCWMSNLNSLHLETSLDSVTQK